MAKGKSGGQRGGGGLSGAGAIQMQPQQPQQAQQQQQMAQAQQAQVDTTTQATPMSVGYQAFMAMTDDQKADVISNSISQGVPSHLSQTAFQKFLYNSGIDDKPDVVSDATLNSMKGTELFRTVNAVYDKKNDISYNADQIGRQVIAGRVTRTSDTGGSVHGRGIYFADRYGASASYGRTSGDVKKTAVIRAKLNSNAKVISESTLLRQMRAEISSGSKLGKTLNKINSDDAQSIYALAKGYNVVDAGSYKVILNRGALTMSSDIKAMGSSW